MPYQMLPPTYDAIQWNGSNTQDVLAQADAWFSCWPGQHAAHDVDAGLITTCNGYQLALGDWLVSPGSWGPGTPHEGFPEVVQDAVFQVKYRTQEE